LGKITILRLGHRRRGGLSLAQPMRSDRRHPVKILQMFIIIIKEIDDLDLLIINLN
jgi:hypothetical protein